MNWSPEQSRDIYAIEHWGEGYFDINTAGRVIAHPGKTAAKKGVDIFEVVQSIRQEGLTLPVLIRFTGILRDRIRLLHESFGKAIDEHGYQADYTPVYPIKVNQQRGVVEGITRNGSYPVGLEAGSNPRGVFSNNTTSEDGDMGWWDAGDSSQRIPRPSCGRSRNLAPC